MVTTVQLSPPPRNAGHVPERVAQVLMALGGPQRAFRAIHVVGTNGKTSTARFAEAILRAHGVRTGAFLSPHLLSRVERIRVDGRPVSEDEIATCIERVVAAAAGLNPDGAAPLTQFAMLTAAALLLFAERGIELAVIEAGLGGRADATNVLDAEVVVLTSVALDHTERLGPTVTDIAREKLGVLGPGSVLITGPLSPSMEEVVDQVRVVRRITVTDPDPIVATHYQQLNVAVAQAAARAAIGELSPACVRRACAATMIPGRFQIIAEAPTTVLDAAHNPAAIAALVRAIRAHCRAAVITQTSSQRALAAGRLAELPAWRRLPTVVEPNPGRALTLARELAGADGFVVATGSMTLLADLAEVRPGECQHPTDPNGGTT